MSQAPSAQGHLNLDEAPSSASPFLRWAGSKRWLAPRIQKLIPQKFGMYFEPFLGSGSIFFSLSIPAERCLLTDSLAPLINCYQQVRESPAEIHHIVGGWNCDEDSYYEVRKIETDDPTTRAAQFIYLNRMCFNGLYRVNQAGKFNVPYGRPRFQRVFSSASELHIVSHRLQGAHIGCTDFESAVDNATRGDLVYLDPPYVAGHRSNGFVDYNARVFRWEDQSRLAELSHQLSARGVLVILSNADHPSIRDLYGKSYQITPVSRFSSMSAAAASRGLSQELLIINKPLISELS